MELWSWIESTALARGVGESLVLTASLSALHLIGFTLVMASTLVFNLSAAGILLRGRLTDAAARPALQLLCAGMGISLVTGFGLFAPRASYTATDTVFLLKMALLAALAAQQGVAIRLCLRRPGRARPVLRCHGAIGLSLGLALAVTACWFILFE